MRFEAFLRERLEAGGFTTEDALAAFLPLLRQVVAAHAEGLVAPLEGLDALHVEGGRIWFEESRLAPPKLNRGAIRRLEEPDRTVVEVVEEQRVTGDIGEQSPTIENLRIGRRDAEVTRPVYLPGYVVWEHLLEHHDPMTDGFSLGMLLASLACGLDLSDDNDLDTFVANRRNLFAIHPTLHPVLAQAITRLTELNRHRRPQDLTSVSRALENYRDQDVAFALDLARAPDFARQDPPGKRRFILTKLGQRLFEISRRNRLLHFRPTLQTVNLTQASVPLSFDARNIRPDQIMIWNEKLHREVASGSGIPLNRHLNFREAVYLPSVLDRIRSEAERDQHEYGFAQLRLVACFLRWANLKQTPAEMFESPFVLVPVRLIRKKGVRDTYWLEPQDAVAEINPVVRHQFRELYAISLPESIDLERTSLDELHRSLAAQIAASEPAVALEKVDRPRIDLIHDAARRRLDQYCRHARLSGRGIRSFLEIDYSYDPANYHPLGLQLFHRKIEPAQTRLTMLTETEPPTRRFAVPPAEQPVAVREKSLYRLRDGTEGNPFTWEFDLCSVTLGNFKYRKMSLVRDYATLLDEEPSNPAFDATFTLTPRQADGSPSAFLPLAEQYHVVACDPTQTAAIAAARGGDNYIIQGPPGTGKSQTITNLIADYVARGKRVLFVCEKRAAIDVVYHRLRQKGLDALCCLIHDSQADKKQFVLDLKQSYETLQAPSKATPGQAERKRHKLLQALERELEPLQRFDAAMKEVPVAGGLPVRRLVGRAIELKSSLPALSPRERERLPPFADWEAHRDRIDRFSNSLQSIRQDGILAQHPLRLLGHAVKDQDRPIEFVASAVERAGRLLERLLEILQTDVIPAACRDSLDMGRALADHAVAAQFLAEHGLLELLSDTSSRAKELRKKRRALTKPESAREAKAKEAEGWLLKLSSQETTAALALAQRFERDPLRFLKPAWWRLRSVLKRNYNFSKHQVRPSFVQVLTWLDEEHRAAAVCDRAQSEICRALALDEPFPEFARRLDACTKSIATLPKPVQEAHRHLVNSADGERLTIALAETRPDWDRLQAELDSFLDDYRNLSLPDLVQRLQDIEDALDELPEYVECLRELARLPRSVATALRTMPWSLVAIEAATVARTVADVLRAERSTGEVDMPGYRRRLEELDRLWRQWQEVNAQLVCERARERFLEHVRLSNLPAAQLSADEKEHKKQYSRGRRELEHEFGKTMRFKPIRDMVSGESGLVVRDLKPVWLMSPLSVSDTLPLDQHRFDVVIFDEASQIPLEEAVPSLFRAAQTIVVGDEMQLPPTNFFSARRGDDEETVRFEEQGELVEYDLESDSLLNHAARNLPARMLGWHYRSRSESLISFSNWAFYKGELLTVPERQICLPDRRALEVSSAGDASVNLREALDRAVSFHFLRHGAYEKRRNRAEAEYIAEMVRGLLADESRPTVGIVAFSEAQQDEIESALERLARENRDFSDRLEEAREREEDDQFVGLLVKNLENIQGDERDIIILSVCYGHGPEGRMRMNFGPINQSGGERRLNVAFSRARRHMAIVSSIRAGDITNDYNDGANCLKNYLQYAEACSSGHLAEAGRILAAMSLARKSKAALNASADIVVDQLSAALRERGYVVETSVGQSHFRCDLAVRRASDSVYQLGILVDTESYYDQTDILERDLMKPALLRAFGWRMAMVFAKSWWESKQEVVEHLIQELEGAAAAEKPAMGDRGPPQ